MLRRKLFLTEKCNSADENGGNAFEDLRYQLQQRRKNKEQTSYKDPRPAQKTGSSAHKADTKREQTRESTGQGGSSKEYTDPPLEHMTWVPKREAGDSRIKVRVE